MVDLNIVQMAPDKLADAAGIKRDRPADAGYAVGKAIAALAEAGRSIQPDLPDACATCAFRLGCMTNAMPATVLDAFKCSTGADDSEFGCHHGMVEGRPVKRCAGWMAAQTADWPDVKRIMAQLEREFETLPERDTIRELYDAWIAVIDPAGELDDYQRGRLWLRDDPCGLLSRHLDKGEG